MNPELYRSPEGDLTLELDEPNGVLLLKALSTFDDPVELTPEAARDLAQRLTDYAERLG